MSLIFGTAGSGRVSSETVWVYWVLIRIRVIRVNPRLISVRLNQGVDTSAVNA